MYLYDKDGETNCHIRVKTRSSMTRDTIFTFLVYNTVVIISPHLVLNT